MQWFIMGRDMHVLSMPSTDSPDSLPLYNDKQTVSISNNTVVSTYEFTIDQGHSDAQYLQLGGYIAFVDKYDEMKMYTLMSHQGDDIQQTWIGEDIGMDLINATADKITATEAHPIAWYLENYPLKGTGWTIGLNEISNLSRKLSFDGQSDSQLTRLGDMANQFDGAEISFSVKMQGNHVTSQVVNIHKKVGSPLIADKYVNDIDLKSLTYNGTIDNLCTSMLAYGSAPESKGESTTELPPITFKDIAYDDGRYYSPIGKDRLYDRQGKLNWSRFRGFNHTDEGEFDGYINGIFTYDTTDPQELLNRTLTELKSRNTPQETYEADLLKIDADIGDYVQIAHNHYNPPIYLRARIQQVENCYTADGQDTGILGDYTRLQSQIDPRVQQMLDGLANQFKYSYTWIRYAKDDKGMDMTSTPTADTKYVAIVSNKPTGVPSDDPADYAGNWQLIQGTGPEGIPGPKGDDGKTSYTHFAYADNVSGTKDFSTDDPTGRSYMGVYSDFTKADSTNPDDYIWSFTKGETGLDGAQGIPGPKGADGKTPYTHIAYADTAAGGGLSQLPDNKKYIGMYVDFTENDSSDPQKYAWSLIKGDDGKDGVAGKDGVGLKSTQIMYAQNTSGTTVPTTGWTAQVPTLIKGQYLWTQTTWLYTDNTGEAGYTVSYNAKDGNNGTDGIAGKDGVGIKSTTITYAQSTGGTVAPTTGYTTTVPSVASGSFLWTKTTWSYTDGTSESGYSVAKMGEKGSQGPQGLQGLQGATGNQGIQGPKGLDGKSSYTHIAYGTSNSGAGFTQTPSTSTTYIGMYVDQTATDSADPSKYAWSLIKGANGAQGTPGAKGADGKTPYFHSAWANSVDGKTGFSTTDSVNKSYLGTYTDFTQGDSADATKYAWSLIKGADGINGKDGIPGKPGADGKTPYFHTAWATSADGKNGFSLTDSANKSYLGTYTDFTQADSTDITKYAWSLIKGRDGSNGAPGKAGTDGKTPYFHQAWADSKDGKINFSATDPTNRGYLGTYSDFTQADSSDPTKYFWVELVGNLQVGGRNYIINSSGFGASNTNRASVKPNYTTSAFSHSAISYNNDSITLTYTGTGTQEWFYAVAEAFRTYDSVGLDKTKQYTISVEAMGTAPGAAFRINNVLSPSVSLSNEKWTKLKYTFKFPDIGEKFYIRLNAFAESHIGNFVQGQTLSFRNFKLEEGNVATDWSPAPEDTQGQIDSINQGLADTNSKIAAVTKVDSQATAPTNPKKGDQWWVKDASNHVTAFKQWDGSKWVDSIIQQSAMNIGTLNGNIINGATINSSNFNVSYDETKENTGRLIGPYYKGTQVIKNGSYLSNYQVKDSTQTGYTYLTPDGITTRFNDSSGNLLNQASLAKGALELQDQNYSGYLEAGDVERTNREEWTTDSGASGLQIMGLTKQFRRVWFDGTLFIPKGQWNGNIGAYTKVLQIKDHKLYPKSNKIIGVTTLGNNSETASIQIQPNGWIVVVWSSKAQRVLVEGCFYTLDF